MQAVVNALNISYNRIGKNDKHRATVVILHGWGDSSKGWELMVANLAKSHDVLSLDLPGFGDSDRPKKVWGLGEYARLIAAFLKKLAITDYVLIGHSNGGAIAIRGIGVGLLDPEKLVLLDSSGIRAEFNVRARSVRALTKTGKALSRPLPKALKKRLRRRVHNSVGSDVMVAEHLQETFKIVMADDVQDDAVRLDVPVLLLYGEDDLSTPPHYGRILHSLIKGSKLEIIPGAGHFVHLDKPDIVLQNIQDFLQ